MGTTARDSLDRLTTEHSLPLSWIATRNFVTSQTLFLRRSLRDGMRSLKEERWTPITFGQGEQEYSLFTPTKINWDSWFFFLRSHSTSRTSSQKEGPWGYKISRCDPEQWHAMPRRLAGRKLAPSQQPSDLITLRPSFCQLQLHFGLFCHVHPHVGTREGRSLPSTLKLISDFIILGGNSKRITSWLMTIEGGRKSKDEGMFGEGRRIY